MKISVFVNNIFSILIIFGIFVFTAILIIFLGFDFILTLGFTLPSENFSRTLIDVISSLSRIRFYYLSFACVILCLFYGVYDLSNSKLLIYIFSRDTKSWKSLFWHNILLFVLTPMSLFGLLFGFSEQSRWELLLLYLLSFMFIYTIFILIIKFLTSFRDTIFAKSVAKCKARIYFKFSKTLLTMYYRNKILRKQFDKGVPSCIGKKYLLLEIIVLFLFNFILWFFIGFCAAR